MAIPGFGANVNVLKSRPTTTSGENAKFEGSINANHIQGCDKSSSIALKRIFRVENLENHPVLVP